MSDLPPLTPPTLTPEEREKRYAELREKAARSRIHAVCRDPNIHVRWVRNEPNDLSLHEWMEYKIAREPRPKAPKDQRRFDTAIPPNDDGTYIIGDVILMECPRDALEFYLNEAYGLSEKMAGAAQKVFRHEAEKLDVPTFVRDKSGRIIPGM